MINEKSQKEHAKNQGPHNHYPEFNPSQQPKFENFKIVQNFDYPEEEEKTENKDDYSISGWIKWFTSEPKKNEKKFQGENDHLSEDDQNEVKRLKKELEKELKKEKKKFEKKMKKEKKKFEKEKRKIEKELRDQVRNFF